MITIILPADTTDQLNKITIKQVIAHYGVPEILREIGVEGIKEYLNQDDETKDRLRRTY